MSEDATPKRLGRRVMSPCQGEERTVQAAKGEVDINTIMSRYMKTGSLNHVNRRQPKYGDFSISQGLMDAWQMQATAEDEFQALEAKIRRAANNSKEEFWRMLATEEGSQILQEAGLDLGLDLVEAEEEGTDSPQKPPESDGVTKDISEQV